MFAKTRVAAVVWLFVCGVIPGSLFPRPVRAADHFYHDAVIGPGDNYDYLYVHDSPGGHTHVRMIGGYVYDLFALDASRITITGGQIADLYARNGSAIDIAGGEIVDVMAYDTSTVNITGGRIIHGLQSEHGSTVNITDGLIGDCVYATDSSVMNIHGGRITDYIVANESATVNIFGRNLQFDPDAAIPSPWGPGTWAGGRITGQYADGSPMAICLVDNLGGTGSNSTFAHVVLHELRTIYVDDDAPVPGDGTTWRTAYTYLQDALMMAGPGAEIRVARGIQKPDLFALSDRPVRGRYETFQLASGVAIRGGYAGIGAADPNARRIHAYETILTGDLLLNDPPCPPAGWEDIRAWLEHPDRDDNCYSVVTARGVDATAVLDGCTITGGHANIYGVYGPWESGPTRPDPYAPENTGGGLYNNAGSPTIARCTFGHNSTISYQADTGGGAIFSLDGAPAVIDCHFIENHTFSGDASCAGGAIRSIHSDTTLAGCSFTGNTAQGFDSEYYGGAILNAGGSLTATDCTFTANKADWGGAIDNAGNGTLALTDCTFTANAVNDNGGAVINNGPLSITDCTFAGNRAYMAGGAVCGGPPLQTQITGCTFTGNHASQGGAIWTSFREPLTIRDCVFTANFAESGAAIESSGAWYQDENGHTTVANSTFTGNRALVGGAVQTGWHKVVRLSNCLFTGNLAALWGGGVFASGSDLSLADCTLADNRAPEGETLAARWDPSTVEFHNCILYNGGNEISDTGASTIAVNYSNIRNGWLGTGNIDTDPLFADPGHWDPNGTPDDPNDDLWLDGDYHLKSQAGRWEPASASWVIDDATSPCIDVGDPMSPIGLEPFPNGGRINMGAYGGTAQASKSYFGGPPCETIVAADLNGDCRVNFADFAIMLAHWLEDNNP